MTYSLVAREPGVVVVDSMFSGDFHSYCLMLREDFKIECIRTMFLIVPDCDLCGKPAPEDNPHQDCVDHETFMMDSHAAYTQWLEEGEWL